MTCLNSIQFECCCGHGSSNDDIKEPKNSGEYFEGWWKDRQPMAQRSGL